MGEREVRVASAVERLLRTLLEDAQAERGEWALIPNPHPVWRMVNALPALLDELIALRGYGEKVRKLLNSLRDDIDPRVDVEDGPNGEPRANFAMRVQQELDAILAIRVPA